MLMDSTKQSAPYSAPLNSPGNNPPAISQQHQLQSNSAERFPKSSVREFSFRDDDVGNILSVALRHAADGDESAAWKPEKIVVQHCTLHRTWTFICPRWLSTDVGNIIELTPTGCVAVGRRASRRASRRISTGKDDIGSMFLSTPTLSPIALVSTITTSSSSSPSNGNDPQSQTRSRFETMRDRFASAEDKIVPTDDSVLASGTEVGIKKVCFQLQMFSRTASHMYISGSIPAMGDWKPEHAIRMTQHTGLDGSWRGEWRVDVDMDDDYDEVEYRYMIVSHCGTEESNVATMTEPIRMLKLSASGQQTAGDRRLAEGGCVYIKDKFTVDNKGLPMGVSPFRPRLDEKTNIRTPNGRAVLRGSHVPPRSSVPISYAVQRDLHSALETSSTDPLSSESSQSNRMVRRPMSSEECSTPRNDHQHVVMTNMDTPGNVTSTSLGHEQQMWRGAGTMMEDGTEVVVHHHHHHHHGTGSGLRNRSQHSDDELSTESTSSHVGGSNDIDAVNVRVSRSPKPSGSTSEEYSPISSETLVDEDEGHGGDLMVVISQEEVNSLRDDRDALQAERNQIVAERDAVTLELDDVRVELQATVRERDSSRAQVENASNSVQTARSFSIASDVVDEDAMLEIEEIIKAATNKADDAKKERDEALEQLDLLKKELNQAVENSEKDEERSEFKITSQERDALRLERDMLADEKIELSAKVERVREENKEKLQSYFKLSESHQNLVKELDGLRGEVVGKQEEIDAQSVHLDNMLAEKEAVFQAELDGLKLERDVLHDRWAKEFRERRKLFNTVQELRGNIRVFCRVRPPKVSSSDKMAVSFPDESLDEQGRLKLGEKNFEFDRVFQPVSTQQDVYDETAGVVASVIDGYNVCVFAYGQTGSGKTHTMNGTDEDRGVNYRALQNLFDITDERQAHFTVRISLSMLEIYNENLRDLILPEEKVSNAPKLEIRKDGSAGSSAHAVYVPNLTEVEVSSFEHVWNVMNSGCNNRSKGRTDMNEHSSRSHLIVRVTVRCNDTKSGTKTRGVLHLVDLAGSERVSRSHAAGDRLKEAQYINKSLSSLGDVFAALTKNQGGHVPYRNSKLTYLLQDSLGGDSKTLMFVNVSSDESDGSESLSSLQFAQRVAKVELGDARKHAEHGTDPKVLQEKEVQNAELNGKVQGLQREIRRRDECIAEMRERSRGLEGELYVLKQRMEQVAVKESSNREGSTRELKEMKAAKEKDEAELKIAKAKLAEMERSREEEIRRLHSMIRSREKEIAGLSVEKGAEEHVRRLQTQLHVRDREIAELKNNRGVGGNKQDVNHNGGIPSTPASIPGPILLGRTVSVPSGIGEVPQQDLQHPSHHIHSDRPQRHFHQQTPMPSKMRLQRTSSSLPGVTGANKSRHVRFESDSDGSGSEVRNDSARSAEESLSTLTGPERHSIDNGPSTANRNSSSKIMTTSMPSSAMSAKRTATKVSMLQPPRRAKDVVTPLRTISTSRGSILRQQQDGGGSSTALSRNAPYSFGSRASLLSKDGVVIERKNGTGNMGGGSSTSSSSGIMGNKGLGGNRTRLPRSQTAVLRAPQRARQTGTAESAGGVGNGKNSGRIPGAGANGVGAINGRMPLRRAGTVSGANGRPASFSVGSKPSTTDRT